MSTAAETAILAGRGLLRFVRTPQLVVDSFALPLLLLFMMLAVFGDIVGDASAGDYVDRLAPAVVLFSAMAGSMVTGIGLFGDVRSGLTDRFRTLPISRLAPLSGRVLADLVRILLAAVATTAVAYLPGFRFTQGPLATLGFFAIVVLFGSAFVWLAILIGLTAKTEDNVNAAVTAPATLLLFFSSGFAPVEAFPGFLQPVIDLNPLSCATNAAISLSSGGPVAIPVLQTIAWTVALTALSAPLAVQLYQHRAVATSPGG